MTDALEDIFRDDERKKETVKLYRARCPGYVWHGPVSDVVVTPPHYYQTQNITAFQKSWTCEDCGELYRQKKGEE